jgi:hypothetical protein
LARIHIITPSSRCWATGPSATTSRYVTRDAIVRLRSSSRQKEAIEFSWELLTEVYKLPKDQLYVTYFEGDAKNGLPPDEEAKQYWLAQGVAEDHIIPGNAKDNFWGKSS